MVPETEWCPSSSGDGRNRCPIGTVGSSGQSPNRCSNLLYGNSGHGRVSTKRGRRSGWQHVVRERFSWLPPHPPAGELEGGCLQGEGVDRQAAESIHTSLGFPGAVSYGEVVFLQGGQPAMKESRSREHCFEPL